MTSATEDKHVGGAMSETERQRGFRDGIAHAKRCIQGGMPGFHCAACRNQQARTATLEQDNARLRAQLKEADEKLLQILRAVNS